MRSPLGAMVVLLLSGCGDVSVSPTGGADAGHDGPPLSFCEGLSPAPRFCDDFDAATKLDRWNLVTATNGAVTVDAGESTSPPGAMRASIEPGTASAYATVYLADQGLSRATLTFAILLDPACFKGTNLNDGLVGVGTTVFGTGEQAYGLALFAGPEGALIYEAGPTGTGGDYRPAATIPAGVWARVSMAIDLAGKKVETRIDGGAPTTSALAFAPATLDAPLVSVGLTGAVSHPTACTARYDDVTFE